MILFLLPKCYISEKLWESNHAVQKEVNHRDMYPTYTLSLLFSNTFPFTNTRISCPLSNLKLSCLCESDSLIWWALTTSSHFWLAV